MYDAIPGAWCEIVPAVVNLSRLRGFGTKRGQQSPKLPGSIGMLGFRVLDFGFRV